MQFSPLLQGEMGNDRVVDSVEFAGWIGIAMPIEEQRGMKKGSTLVLPFSSVMSVDLLSLLGGLGSHFFDGNVGAVNNLFYYGFSNNFLDSFGFNGSFGFSGLLVASGESKHANGSHQKHNFLHFCQFFC